MGWLQVPYYLGLILGDAVVALRVLRLMRVVRLLKRGAPGYSALQCGIFLGTESPSFGWDNLQETRWKHHVLRMGFLAGLWWLMSVGNTISWTCDICWSQGIDGIEGLGRFLDRFCMCFHVFLYIHIVYINKRSYKYNYKFNIHTHIHVNIHTNMNMNI